MTIKTLASVDGSDLMLTSPVAWNVPAANADCDILSIKQIITIRYIIFFILRLTEFTPFPKVIAPFRTLILTCINLNVNHFVTFLQLFVTIGLSVKGNSDSFDMIGVSVLALLMPAASQAQL